MRQTSRRKFFEESMIATALAAGGAAVGQAVAADATGSKSDSPNERIRHAVIGCRIRGKVHASSFGRIPGVEIAYVCDPDSQLSAELATAVEEQHGKRPQVVQDLRRIFDDPNVDTVSIAAPNHWHALAAIWAMQSGKDVYVEKPVSHNVDEGRRIVQVAHKLGRICQAGTQNRSRGDLAAAAEYIRQGKLGEIGLIRTIMYGRRGSIGGPGKCDIPPHVDFNLWLGPATDMHPTRPRLHYDWHWVWDTGGGELANNNIHYVDICRWLAGLQGLGDSVLSFGGRLGYEDAGQTPNTQVVVHRYGPQTIIQEVRGLKSDPFSSKFKAGHVIHGSEGFIAEGSLFDPEGQMVRTFKGPGVNHFANFIDCVRSRRREDLKAEILEGHLSTSLCHLGNISYRLGQSQSPSEITQQLEAADMPREVITTLERMTGHLRDHGVKLDQTPLTAGPLLKIDNANEKFVDNQAADRLLSREYRRPFVVPAASEI
ncbi:MAG: Gfo/Idh/MocA family oxidoreductase [Planctomycetales bacterium]|nr:Gfo/Idh/MocA family oxidoreductase [Planctomycetales bacterium]